jgi:DNA-binding winged helix-turn-helix (wHTH) protein
LGTSGSSRFLDFTFDFDRDELKRDDASIKLRPKTLALLRVFLRRPGETLAKAELTRLLWPGLAVTEVVLNVCVAELRRVFADAAASPRYIETMHRRGFRFIAPINSYQSEVPAGDSADAEVFVGRRAELKFSRSAGAERVRVTAGGDRGGDAGISKTALIGHFSVARCRGRRWNHHRPRPVLRSERRRRGVSAGTRSSAVDLQRYVGCPGGRLDPTSRAIVAVAPAERERGCGNTTR